MLLRALDPKKRKEYKQKENEAIQFKFDLENDTADSVVREMVFQSLIPEADASTVTKLLYDRISQLSKDRDVYQREQKRKQEEHEKQKEEQELKDFKVLNLVFRFVRWIKIEYIEY